MQEINIYKVTEESFGKIFSKLIESIVAQGKKIYLLCNDAEEEKKLDYLLWSYSQLSFIPHGTTSDPYQQDQIVLLGTNPELIPPNEAVIFLSILRPEILKENFLHSLLAKYEKILFFDKNDSLNLRVFKQLEAQVNLIEQDSTGKWVKESMNR